ncbi:uncharacterized protein LOC119650318 isoform X1 [Hermetia illucens]|nr:uncharacterized protein LOC119650318 isoform X1 [Hermetia illucens]
MKMSKLSNQTNSQDPQAVNSRIFVGNLNTFQCSKTDVERMFQRYGRLAGISMHKGYAFVQFTNPFDARNACHGEDGRTVLSQVLDVNMVAEPKPHQIGRKRQNVTKTGNDWDYYYDSYCASALFPTTGPRPMKRQRLMAPQNRGVVGNPVQQQQQQQQKHQAAAAAMAAMAASAAAQAVQVNMLPQQQIVLHQQSLLANGSSVNNIVASCNGNAGTTVHNLSNSLLNGAGHPTGILVQPTTASSNNNHSGLTNCEQMPSVCNNGQHPHLHHLQQQHHQHQQPHQQQHLSHHQLLGPFKVYSNPDTLICGNCRECFSDLGELLDHKRNYCKLRFTCKCQDTLSSAKTPSPTTKLLCAVCKDSFSNPWDLMVHAQAAHMVNIYELGSEENGTEPKEQNHAENGVVNGSVNGSMSSISNGDAEPAAELNSEIGSPAGSIAKEETHSDEASLDGRISTSSPAPQSEDMKLNGSISSRDSSPALEGESPRACIVRAMSIDASSPNPPPGALGMVATTIAISLGNGPTSSAAAVPTQ